MTEQTAPTTGTEETNSQAQQQEQPKEFQAITSQEDFDKAIQARIARERAKIPTDYEQMKADSAELAKIRESQKTEAQKQQDALAAAEKRAADAELQVLRAQVAEAASDPSKGITIPASLLSGSTKEELEASAKALIQFRGEQPKPGLHIPREGKEPAAAGGTLGEQFAGFFNQQTGGE